MDKKDVPGGVPNGNGSLSSGSSIVTISSNSVLDPDAERRKDLNGDGRDIRNEKWYHTILQVSIPFFIAGLGTIGAGRVLTTAKVKILPKEDTVYRKETRMSQSSIFISFSILSYPLSFSYKDIFSKNRRIYIIIKERNN